MDIIITSPSLDTNDNVSGMSSVANFIIGCNTTHKYIHFRLGKKDEETRNLTWALRIFKTYLKWVKVLLSNPNAIIHFNLALDKRALIRDAPLIWTSRLFRKRMILHLHGGEMFMEADGPWWMGYLLKLSLAGHNPKLVSSGREKLVLKKMVNADNIFVLPNCISLNEAVECERRYLEDELPIILFLGRISRSKGIDDIYQALASLQDRALAFTFLMAGKGPDEKHYVSKFKDLLGGKFEFRGVVSGNQKTELLKHCNIFLLPSLFEGLPMALLESMSFGLVPIVTDVGSIRHVVTDQDNGIIVKPNAPDQIVLAVEKLAHNGQYMQRLSRNARRYIVDNCSQSRYLNNLNTLYQYEQHYYVS